MLEGFVREEVDLLGEILVEDEAEDVVAEVIGPHLTAEGIGDVPELGFELSLVVVCHVSLRMEGNGRMNQHRMDEFLGSRGD